MALAGDHLVGTLLDGKYEVESLLGSGGMGRVYKGQHVGTGRSVAIKVISEDLAETSEVSLRFQREARIAGSLRHPNIVDVTDYGISRHGGKGTAYLVMEYLQGQTLRQILDVEERLVPMVMIDIVEQIALAIDQAHRFDIVHRDLKPENIWLISDSRGGYQVKVLDFGIAAIHRTARSETGEIEASPVSPATDQDVPTIARQGSSEDIPTAVHDGHETTLSEAETRTLGDRSSEATIVQPEERSALTPVHAGQLTVAGSTLGTPRYMSPEQCRGEKVDFRSDLYSLGVIAFESVAGRRPFDGSMIEVLNKHISEPAPRLDQCVEGISTALADVIDRSLSKDPADRYPSASAFAGNLQVASEGASLTLRRALSLYSERLDQFLPLLLRVCRPLLYFELLLIVATILILVSAPRIDMLSLFAFLVFASALWTITAIWSHSLFAFVTDQIRIHPLSRIDADTIQQKLLDRIDCHSRSFLSRTWALTRFYVKCELFAPTGMGDLSFNVAALEGLPPKEAGKRAATLGKAVEKRYAWIRIAIIGSLALFPAMETALVMVLLTFAGLDISLLLPVWLFMTLILLNAFWNLPVMSIALTLLYFRARQAGGEDVPLGALVSTRL